MNIKILFSILLKPFNSWRNKYLKYSVKNQARKLNLYEKALIEVGEYTGESAEVVKERQGKLGPDSEKRFEIFKEQKKLTAESVEDFYKKQ